jgi:hypothetical protein
MNVPDNLIPLVYLAIVAVIGGAFHWLGVPIELTMLIVGAGLTRVKVSSNEPTKPPGA